MANMLKDWLKTSRTNLEDRGFTVNIAQGYLSTSVDIDSNRFVGGICFWKPNKFEFQFHDCDSEEVVFLETVELDSLHSITEYLEALISKLDIK